MKIWSLDEEAANLRARFQGVNRAAFAREHSIPGGQAMIYQHITGRRPLNLEAATAYARGFRCALDEISPRLAAEAGRAAALSSDAPSPAAPLQPTEKSWPFPSIAEHEIRSLPASQLSALEGAIALAIAQLKIGIRVAAPQRDASRSGSLAPSMDSAADPFPQAPVEPAPWAPGGVTTKQQEREEIARRQIVAANEVAGNVAPGEPHPSTDKFEKVPELADVRLAAGDGIENDSEFQTGVIQFRKSFLRSVGADGGRGVVVYAKGDSMEPVIRDGAALLVVPTENLTLQDVASGGVYAINYGGKMLVKAVARDKLTQRWVARSLNPAFPDIPLEDGDPVRVLGQVVWAGARLRDDEAKQCDRP